MIETKKDLEGKVLAYIVWQVVDKDGHPNVKGMYVWIDDFYIAPQYRNNGIMLSFIDTIANKKAPWTKYCYFTRRYNREGKEVITKPRLYTREQLVKGGKDCE